DLRAGRGVLDGGARLDPAAARHPDVHQDDVRQQVAGHLDGLVPVAALADHLDVVLALEDHLQTSAEQRMVVDDEHADRIRTGRRRGLPAGGGGAGAGLTGYRRGVASLGILAHQSRGVEETPLPPFTIQRFSAIWICRRVCSPTGRPREPKGSRGDPGIFGRGVSRRYFGASREVPGGSPRVRGPAGTRRRGTVTGRSRYGRPSGARAAPVPPDHRVRGSAGTPFQIITCFGR